MCNITIEPVFQYTLHRRLWNILADNPGMDKYEALTRFFTEEEQSAFGGLSCTACSYTSMVSNTKNVKCTYCPLDDSNVQADPVMEIANGCLKGLHGAYTTARDILSISFSIETYLSIVCGGDKGKISRMINCLGPDFTKEKMKEICSKYARMIADLPVKPGIMYI